MTKLEFACVIIGFISFLLVSVEIKGDISDKQSRHLFLQVVISRVISGLMILLPLYFNYWR